MSENEKKQRSLYQQRRNRWIAIQSAILLLLTIALLFTGTSFVKANRATYIPYTEEGEVLYKAYLADNAFYSEEYLNGSHAYVASLVERMTADFTYTLEMAEKDVQYRYAYQIDAQVEVKDRDSQMAIYNPVFSLKPATTATAQGNTLKIEDQVKLDYQHYNELAKSFIAAYHLEDVESSLIVRMKVNVLGESKAFVKENEGEYTIALHVPLNKATVTPHTALPVEEEAQKILVVNNKNRNVYKVLLILFAVLELLAAILVALFVILTRDKHIDYARKVKRLLASYRSYIQKISNPFDMAEYRVLNVETFAELLEIRDTLQMPILLYENEDQTRSQFFIVAQDGIVYSFEISVEDDVYQNPVMEILAQEK